MIWMQVTKDRFELPICIADTAKELAEKCHTTEDSIHSAIYHAEKKGYRSQYVRVREA